MPSVPQQSALSAATAAAPQGPRGQNWDFGYPRAPAHPLLFFPLQMMEGKAWGIKALSCGVREAQLNLEIQSGKEQSSRKI